ncbi:mediator of RNA polymerase II transcription subunit 1 [Lingula anatina]|uniref:Mediator of RNA polymerase II transcription subunit 1 n=1 Tax=Lingula anatina TaxID=7574 RepID=A0A1S3HG88_LINAN|nr:mediator of RNA polymerase II transcription subunit 1 [Lingula anatina]|eukprot:XP_013385075.1 mediator of RNA polymerase II transcription subunit 1 [Lingula anatina]
MSFLSMFRRRSASKSMERSSTSGEENYQSDSDRSFRKGSSIKKSRVGTPTGQDPSAPSGGRPLGAATGRCQTPPPLPPPPIPARLPKNKPTMLGKGSASPCSSTDNSPCKKPPIDSSPSKNKPSSYPGCNKLVSSSSEESYSGKCSSAKSWDGTFGTLGSFKKPTAVVSPFSSSTSLHSCLSSTDVSSQATQSSSLQSNDIADVKSLHTLLTSDASDSFTAVKPAMQEELTGISKLLSDGKDPAAPPQTSVVMPMMIQDASLLKKTVPVGGGSLSSTRMDLCLGSEVVDETHAKGAQGAGSASSPQASSRSGFNDVSPQKVRPVARPRAKKRSPPTGLAVTIPPPDTDGNKWMLPGDDDKSAKKSSDSGQARCKSPVKKKESQTKEGTVSDLTNGSSTDNKQQGSKDSVRSSPASTTLRPRFGKEYQTVDRKRLLADSKSPVLGSPARSPRSPALTPTSVFTFDLAQPGSPTKVSIQSSPNHSRGDPQPFSHSPSHYYVQYDNKLDSPKAIYVNVASPRAVYMNVDLSPPSSPVLPQPSEQSNPMLNYAEIDLTHTGAVLRRPSQKTCMTEYTTIDMVATVAAQRVGKEHAQLREDSLLRRDRRSWTPQRTVSNKDPKDSKLQLAAVEYTLAEERKASTCSSNSAVSQ